MMYLVSAVIVISTIFALTNEAIITPALLGIILIAPYMLALIVGNWIFNPNSARIYRIVGYTLIVGGSTLLGLPPWGML